MATNEEQSATLEAKHRAIREGRFLLIPADTTEEELEVVAAIFRGELPYAHPIRDGRAWVLLPDDPRGRFVVGLTTPEAIVSDP